MVLRNIITKHVSENILRTYGGRWRVRRVPKVVIDYVDLDEMPRDEKDKLFIRALQFYLVPNMDGAKKYVDNLFYMGPLYHRIFPALNKLIFLDVGKVVCLQYLSGDLCVQVSVMFPTFSCIQI